MDGQTLPGILIHHCQETNGFAVTGTKGHLCPDVVPSLWPQCKPESAPFGLFGWYLESFPSPDPLHPLVVHSPSLPLQHGSHPPVPIPSVPTGQPNHCVDRGCSSARQARRSEMPYLSPTTSTHLRRRAGLRSFPVLPPSESGCPTSGPLPHA